MPDTYRSVQEIMNELAGTEFQSVDDILRAAAASGGGTGLTAEQIAELLAYADLAGKTYHPKSILDYPAIGSSLSEMRSEVVDDPDATWLMYQGAGTSGVVRNIHATQCATMGTRTLLTSGDAFVKVWCDVGDLTAEEKANGPASTPTLELPLAIYCGAIYDLTSDSKALETAIGTYSLVAAPPSNESISAFTIDLNLPMPYSNGIFIQLWAFGAPSTGGFSSCTYESGALPNWPYKDWRLRGTSVLKQTVAKNASQTWLTVAAEKPGMLVGLWYSMLTAAEDKSFLRSDFTLTPDGLETGSWKSAGVDGVLEGNAYFVTAGLLQRLRSGVTSIEYVTNTSIEAYRLFTDAPLIWQDGAVGTWVNGSLGTPGTVEFSSFALYYAP
jgi:hypothetical protein